MIWFTALDRGNHGMADSFKYRKMISEFIFEGKSPAESSEEDRIASARNAVGAPAPETALEQARRLRERLGRKAPPAEKRERTDGMKFEVAENQVRVERRSPMEQARELHQRLKKNS